MGIGFPSTLPCIDGTSVVCGKDKFIITKASVATDVLMSDCYWIVLTEASYNFVRKSQERVVVLFFEGVIAVVQGLKRLSL